MAKTQPDQNGRRSSAQTLLTALGVVLCVVFGFTLICNLTIIIKGALYPELPPSVLGVTPMAVKSGSMSGTEEGHIEVGDLVLVTRADPESLQVGDVIAFMENGFIVTHRIIEVVTTDSGARSFITRGDANNAVDTNAVTTERLVGVLWLRIPKLGDFVLFLQTPVGMLLFIGAPLAGLVLWDVFRRRRDAEQEKKRAEALEAELDRLRSQSAVNSGDQT